MRTGFVAVAASSGSGPGAPGVPLNLSAVTASITSVLLEWDVPLSDGGSAITDYTVEYTDDEITWNTFTDGVSTSTSATVTGLTTSVEYLFRVKAVNAVGNSPYATVPGEPLPYHVVTTNTATASSNSLSFFGTVNAVYSAATVTFRFGTDPTLTAYFEVTANQSPVTVGTAAVTGNVADLDYVTEYYYAVVASDGVNTTIGSILSTTTGSGAPSASNSTDTYYEMSIGSPPTQYSYSMFGYVNPNGASATVTIQYRTVGAPTWTSVTPLQGSTFTGTSLEYVSYVVGFGTDYSQTQIARESRIVATNSNGTAISNVVVTQYT